MDNPNIRLGNELRDDEYDDDTYTRNRLKTMIRTLLFSTDVNQRRNVFLTGPAGVGKSELIKHIISTCPSHINLGITATTGLAANLIGGVTLNSFLGIGLGRDTVLNTVRNIKRNASIVDRWIKTDVLIVDEVGMLTAELFDKLNEIGKIVRRQKNEIFGNIRLLFAGDFLQLPCINGTFCFESGTWSLAAFKTIYLRTSMRQLDDRFRTCLNNARVGQLTDDDVHTLNTCRLDESDTIKATKIFCKNVDVDHINEQHLYSLNADRVYRYDIEIVQRSDGGGCGGCCDGSTAATAVVGDLSSKRSLIEETVRKQCNASTVVRLSVGAQVMLIANIDQSTGLVNGSRGVVMSFNKADNCPIVRFKNQTRPIGYHSWEVKIDERRQRQCSSSSSSSSSSSLVSTVFDVYQIPLKLGYAVTVHKSQGCTIDAAFIDLKDVFEFGQAYVAISRVKNLQSLHIVNVDRDKFKANASALRYYSNLQMSSCVSEVTNDDDNDDDTYSVFD